MSSLKEVRNRIESVKSTEQITNAMKMVAASKLRKAQEAILRLRPYSYKLNEIITNISRTTGVTDDNPFGPRYGEGGRVLIIAVSSNKGLCGTFNNNVIKNVLHLLEEELTEYMDQDRADILCVGKKVYDYFNKHRFPVIGEYNNIYQQLTFDNVEGIAAGVMDGYVAGRWEKVVLVYNQFRNAAVQIVTREQFLPVEGAPETDEPFWGIDYLYEPEKGEILRTLIPQALKIQFFKILLDSFASEHGARMTAMHQASDNAGEMLKDLKLAYNKARQASITREIIEIVSGAEALKG
jgi:F-type H+-transporting ATPase subunit gamma